ncbi:hypothetical protein J3Q64DRAFT_1824565 [Phycomyces blakesleeanus]|uniref:Apoptogenic protein 1, mitochondrial n=2 Tax=Phycomyces blakesleeanus TaxID=4837 RepID=A0A162TGK3_PHYB8|nr:hypothetical protein PHYBLDRAFT_173406 [Phycomyces blakesleeanus NRRL 1555(-)]OAD68412.1 hypothetical protein PHYBLDRAFT_173406 [Phycomyces blakesleeanus NRRL 1555(-)]|eukprot:XP_018286452.1 hypothetical protein PHYBLDRAFT_173406 [Phycomyces blakesleeanus NRRL 1555(-)]
MKAIVHSLQKAALAIPMRSGVITRTMSSCPEKKHDWMLRPVEADMIGTPDPVSNLRPVKYYIPQNESEQDKEWRLIQQSADEFNQNFWTTNNAMFVHAKAEYESQLNARGKEVTPEELSIFYKDFLNKAYQRQMEYNRQWWKINIGLIYPGFKAAIRSLSKTSSQKSVERKGTGFWEKSFD